MTLRDKVCIVTGAASGMGKAIAARFAREGGRVAVADLRIEAAHRTVAESEAAGGTAVAIAMDVTDEAQVREGVARVVAMWGGVDVQIPEQARALGMSESDVVKKVMLKETVDGEFTTVDDDADVTLMFASFPSSALTGQSMVVSHGWFMQ
jgi:NADP-dependent 3-hydroxy acid dehydrogenase YdfG